MQAYQIGIDLGGTKIESVLFDPQGRENQRIRISTPRNQTDTYIAILEAVEGLIRNTINYIPQPQHYTIGVGIPGTIHKDAELVQNANTTSLNGKPFKHDLEKKLGCRIGIENDANCFTLAESTHGAAEGYPMVFGIILGTGCGGGLCINGHVHQGKHWIAGEWGHFPVDPVGAQCFCGNHGCIETKISGSGVEKAYLRKYKKHLSMPAIVEGFREGKVDCIEVFEEFLKNFGRCLGGLISTLDPDAIVLGGGLSKIDELYTLGVEQVRHYAFHEHVTTPILRNKLGDSAGVYGAAWIGAQ